MLQAVKSFLIHGVDKTVSASTPPAVRSSSVAVAENNAVRRSPASESSLSLHVVAEKAKQAADVVYAVAHIAPLNPLGFVASALTGPKIETSQGSYSIPQLLTNAVVNRVEEKYAVLTRDAHYKTPERVASWPELFERLPSYETLLQDGLLVAGVIAEGRRNPSALIGVVKTAVEKRRITQALNKNEQVIKQAEQLLKTKQAGLALTQKELQVMQKAGDVDFGKSIEGWKKGAAKLEKEIEVLDRQLSKLNREKEKLTKQQNSSKTTPKKK